MKLRVRDYTYEEPVTVGEYWSQQDAEKAIHSYINDVQGDCDELTCEQYDYHYEIWTSFTPATAAVHCYIKAEMDRYWKGVKHAEISD